MSSYSSPLLFQWQHHLPFAIVSHANKAAGAITTSTTIIFFRPPMCFYLPLDPYIEGPIQSPSSYMCALSNNPEEQSINVSSSYKFSVLGPNGLNHQP